MRSLRMVAGLLLCLLPYQAMAQSFPVKPMRIVVRAPPGGTDDLLGRLIVQKMAEFLGQPMVVDYRTGAGGLVAWETPEQMLQLARQDGTQIERIVRTAGIKGE